MAAFQQDAWVPSPSGANDGGDVADAVCAEGEGGGVGRGRRWEAVLGEHPPPPLVETCLAAGCLRSHREVDECWWACQVGESSHETC